VLVVWRGSVDLNVPVEDIVASLRMGEKETGIRMREEDECLKAFVKQ
jgi:hypothetical protein